MYGLSVVLLLLVISSGLISGSEVAFFSLSPNDAQLLKDEDSVGARRILSLKEQPRTLLATILVANNFINIAIVILSAVLVENSLGEERLAAWGTSLYELGLGTLFTVDQLASIINFTITVGGVTAVLVLFGELAPKIYATINNLRFAKLMATPLSILRVLLSPVSSVLVKWSNKLETRITSSSSYQSSTSKEDIDAAIELTVTGENDRSEEEADILKGIVKFGDVSAKSIMRSRVDVTALEQGDSFKDVINTIKESGYSRIPVYTEDFDNIVGILYVKDLLGNTSQPTDYDWQQHIRPTVLYVPESKKIDELLKEFQLKRTHMAIVVDEYGGSAGVVTLEDVMEEIIGDIKDEFDEDEEVEYVELSPGRYIFEGKTLLYDVCRAIGVDTSYFDDVKGESDSLAGLMIEIAGVIPKKEREIKIEDVLLKIVSVSKRRIEKIAVTLDKD